MKKSIILFAAMLLTVTAFAQSPQGMSYQSVIRDATGDLLTETTVGIQISLIRATSSDTVAVYVETHTPMTNINGLVSLEIGMGTSVTGNFADIDWGNGGYFIQCETDSDGGISYSLSGVSELLSVPYALFANEVANASFTTIDNVTSNRPGVHTTDDFVFGSPTLEGDGNFEHVNRMYFDKSKGAFRVGGAASNQWDVQNVGTRSTATGVSTTASGNASTAMGEGTTASGLSSTAMGTNTYAIGDRSTAMGLSTTASGDYSIATGISTTAGGHSSTAMGNTTTASGDFSTAMGKNTAASGLNSLAMGNTTTASGVYSTAMGRQTTASGSYSTAMGGFTTASGVFSTAMGWSTIASGDFSTAMGRSTTAHSYGETSIGLYSTSYSPLNDGGWNALDRLFVIGNGTLPDSRSDAMVVLKNGNVGLGTSTPNESLEIAGDGRAFFGDGGGSNRTGLLIDGTWQSHATRIESYDYGTGQGLDLVINEVGNGNVGIRVQDPNVSLDVSGSIEYTGTITDVSDERLKENFESIDNPVESISQLQGYSYNMKDDKEMIREYGVIAQEIQKVFPELVTVVDEENGYLGVSYVQLIPIMIEAIKEQQEIISGQHTRIESMETELSQTKSDYGALHTELGSQQELIRSNTQLLQELNSILKAQTQR